MKGVGRPRPGEEIRMNQVGEKFDSVNNARARAGEVRVGVDDVGAVIADGRQLGPAGLLF